jgi:tRNA pseudouridine55 synthase
MVCRALVFKRPSTVAMSPNHYKKTVRRAVHGVLLVDKPVGPSSTKVLGRIKGIFRAQKAGHGGTLDPMASGMLPILLGDATKFAQAGLDADKSYRAQIRLGQTSDTGDAEGQLSQPQPVLCTHEEVEAVLHGCLGAQIQVPPMYSALKHQGRPLYAYAREGRSIAREGREIVIHEIRLEAWESPDLTVSVRCSKGTYIRTLAETIGQRLGCGGYLAGLRRTGLAVFTEADMVDLDAIATTGAQHSSFQQASDAGPDARDLAALDRLLLPVDALIAHWPELALTDQQSQDFMHGKRLTCGWSMPEPPEGQAIRIKDSQQRFLGVAHFSMGVLHPKRLVASPSSDLSSLGDY